MKKTIFTVSLIVALSIIVCVAFLTPNVETFIGSDVDVIIDAGHGYPDGGAVAADNTVEADLNLSIAKKLYEKLSQCNVRCIMTRKDENSIYSTGNTIHEKKVSDIRNRVKLASDNKDALVISIHMNTFPSSDVCGIQVFYKPSSTLSKDVAKEIQSIINLKIQKNNTKVIKPIPSNIYLFNHIDNDCVLVECGFLTNEKDLLNLKNEDYQNKIVNSISEAVMYKLYGG